jgi:hypothetical protein
MTHYILDGHEPTPTDTATWTRWMTSADRTVARTAIGPDIIVSTVFVGLDLGGDPDKPVLFETEIMESGVASTECRHVRYATWDEAEHGHRQIVREYRAG